MASDGKASEVEGQGLPAKVRQSLTCTGGFSTRHGGAALERLQQLPALQLHPGEVERPLPEVALERDGNPAIAVQVAEPLAVFGVREVSVGPIVDELVPPSVFFVFRDRVREQCSDAR